MGWLFVSSLNAQEASLPLHEWILLEAGAGDQAGDTYSQPIYVPSRSRRAWGAC